jgi:hypothetical protein
MFEGRMNRRTHLAGTIAFAALLWLNAAADAQVAPKDVVPRLLPGPPQSATGAVVVEPSAVPQANALPNVITPAAVGAPPPVLPATVTFAKTTTNISPPNAPAPLPSAWAPPTLSTNWLAAPPRDNPWTTTAPATSNPWNSKTSQPSHEWK